MEAHLDIEIVDMSCGRIYQDAMRTGNEAYAPGMYPHIVRNTFNQKSPPMPNRAATAECTVSPARMSACANVEYLPRGGNNVPKMNSKTA